MDDKIPEAVMGGSETILIVDDEYNIRDFCSKIFVSMGYRTLSADSGENAVAIYSENMSKIDLVILDLNMPGMGGRRCLQELVALNPDAKVIIASGYSDVNRLKDTLDSGARAYLAKPFRMASMLKAVREILDG